MMSGRFHNEIKHSSQLEIIAMGSVESVAQKIVLNRIKLRFWGRSCPECHLAGLLKARAGIVGRFQSLHDIFPTLFALAALTDQEKIGRFGFLSCPKGS
jgi:hypothetical protein